MITSTAIEEQDTTKWKLYDNPFFQIPSFSSQSHFHKHLVRKYSASAKHVNRLHRDLKFDYPSSKFTSGIDQARTQIAKLKDELEFERKMRKKAECFNKMMARELVDQRRDSELMCDDLNKEIALLKSQIAQKKVPSPSSCSTSSSSSNSTAMAGAGKQTNSGRVAVLPMWENPHIKRGIKGFVEFPRLVKAINRSISDGSKCREMGITKMECQKAQLKILLKQKSSLASSNLIIG